MTKTKKIILNTILVVAVATLLFGGYKLTTTMINYYKAEKLFEELSNSVAVENNDYKPRIEVAKTSKTETYKEEYGNPPDINWDELKAKNKDVVGWIWIPFVNASYPVMHSDIDQYYLRRDINKEHSIAGSIFIDYKNNKDLQDVNTIFYGHNMRNGSMFGQMSKAIDPKNYPFNPYVWILTPQGDFVYKMFASFVEEPVGDAYYLFKKDGSDPARFESWANEMTSRSLVPFDKPEPALDLNSHVITLSSCNQNNKFRNITMAYRVFENYKTATAKTLD